MNESDARITTRVIDVSERQQTKLLLKSSGKVWNESFEYWSEFPEWIGIPLG